MIGNASLNVQDVNNCTTSLEGFYVGGDPDGSDEIYASFLLHPSTTHTCGK